LIVPLTSVSPAPNIDILLPAKERFSPSNAGAISGVVRDLVQASRAAKQFRIIGTDVETSLMPDHFTGLLPKMRWLNGHNIGLAAAYLDLIQKTGAPELVEVHSRCHVARYLAQKRPALNVTLYLHNDPRQMKGGRSVSERRYLLQKLAGIICVSDYIRNCFLDGLDDCGDLASKVGVARNGAHRWLKQPPTKENFILLAGRMVPEKGILECATAIAQVLPHHPGWALIIAGAKRFEESAPGSYEEKIATAIAPLKERAKMLGFIPIADMRDWQARAAISACPSLWHDPMPKAVLESLAAGCALITTRRGGIPEAAEGRALIIDAPSVTSFANGFDRLLGDAAFRQNLQQIAWQDFPFTDTAMAKAADQLRLQALTDGRRKT
jgi:glycosyltransferase involved in cell wall biosynthesis